MLGNLGPALDDAGCARTAEAVVERREAHRIHTVCRFARVASHRDQGLWRVLNISDRGMMFSSSRQTTLGEPLSISLSDNVMLAALVIWSEDERCGVRFVDPVDSTALLCALATEQRSPRHRSLRLAVDGWALAFDEAGIHSVRVRNISRHGVGLDHPNRLQRGGAVKLLFESGAEHRGVVRWANAEQAGLFLLEPFTPYEMASARLFRPPVERPGPAPFSQ
jgi:hypothetical protein